VALSETDVLSGRLAVFESAGQEGFEGAGGKAEIISYQPERVVIRARMESAGALVLNDAFFDGWQARVDGVAVPIHRANYLVRGLLLPAGEHEVIFSYPLPRAVVIGALLSIATLAMLIGAILFGRRNRPALFEVPPAEENHRQDDQRASVGGAVGDRA
jgi:hypothetical protein